MYKRQRRTTRDPFEAYRHEGAGDWGEDEEVWSMDAPPKPPSPDGAQWPRAWHAIAAIEQSRDPWGTGRGPRLTEKCAEWVEGAFRYLLMSGARADRLERDFRAVTALARRTQRDGTYEGGPFVSVALRSLAEELHIDVGTARGVMSDFTGALGTPAPMEKREDGKRGYGTIYTFNDPEAFAPAECFRASLRASNPCQPRPRACQWGGTFSAEPQAEEPPAEHLSFCSSSLLNSEEGGRESEPTATAPDPTAAGGAKGAPASAGSVLAPSMGRGHEDAEPEQTPPVDVMPKEESATMAEAEREAQKCAAILHAEGIELPPALRESVREHGYRVPQSQVRDYLGTIGMSDAELKAKVLQAIVDAYAEPTTPQEPAGADEPEANDNDAEPVDVAEPEPEQTPPVDVMPEKEAKRMGRKKRDLLFYALLLMHEGYELPPDLQALVDAHGARVPQKWEKIYREFCTLYSAEDRAKTLKVLPAAIDYELPPQEPEGGHEAEDAAEPEQTTLPEPEGGHEAEGHDQEAEDAASGPQERPGREAEPVDVAERLFHAELLEDMGEDTGESRAYAERHRGEQAKRVRKLRAKYARMSPAQQLAATERARAAFHEEGAIQ